MHKLHILFKKCTNSVVVKNKNFTKFKPPYFFWIEKFWKSVCKFGKSRSFCFGNHILPIKINELYTLYKTKNQSAPK